jgi:putative tricarboxylic transport membrane protein
VAKRGWPRNGGRASVLRMTHAVIGFLSRQGRPLWSLLLFMAALVLLLLLNAQGHFRSAAGELGPNFWPQVWLGALLALSALDFVVELRKARAPAPAQARPRENLRLVVIGTLAVAGYALAMTLIGFALATAIFLAGFAALGGYRNMPVLALIAVASTVALLYLFVEVVYISLPLGAGPFVEMNVALYRLLGIF